MICREMENSSKDAKVELEGREARRIAIRESKVKELMKSYDRRPSVGEYFIMIVRHFFVGMMITVVLGGLIAALQK